MFDLQMALGLMVNGAAAWLLAVRGRPGGAWMGVENAPVGALGLVLMMAGVFVATLAAIQQALEALCR